LQPCLNTTKVARQRHILAMVFGKKREKDIVREQSRSISRAQRETERERSKLEREEKKIKEDLKELLRKVKCS
jgi:Sec-independent protein translocase protein TatA